MNDQKSVAFHTLGCKLNFAETSTLARQFEQNGFQKTSFEDAADVYVINTCSVTEDANRECRRIVRNALRNSPGSFIIVTGCYAQLKPEEIATIKGVDLVLGATEKFNALKFLNETIEKRKTTPSAGKAEIHSCSIEDADVFNSAYSSGERTRSFLKVQDGCDYNCSYCTIPLARGASRSDSIENVLRNAEKIASQGIKEIVLTGVNVGDFHPTPSLPLREGDNSLLTLIKALDSLPSLLRRSATQRRVGESQSRASSPRFRISSIEPNLLTNEIIQFVANSERFVPHFHIPLQSGSDKILKLMRRRYKRELYAERVQKIKSLMPHACIGTDVIVGFPGETEEIFLETYNFLDSLDVSYLHVFTYSERNNTEAVELTPIVPMEERRKRNRALRNLSNAKQVEFYSENIGAVRNVLFERENKEGFIHGFTENYVKVRTKYDPDLVYQLREVHLNAMDPDGTMLREIEKAVQIVNCKL